MSCETISNSRRDHFLYSPFERKLHPIRLPNRSRPERYLGSSSDGWLCMVDNRLDLSLLNPFSRALVTLPPLRTNSISEPTLDLLHGRTTANPFSCNRNSWAEANSLDDGMLFLGLNTSMWLPSRNFNECNGNSIYFTGADMFLGDDSGVYNLEDRSYGSMYDEAMKSLYPKPVWVVPYPLKKKKVGFLA